MTYLPFKSDYYISRSDSLAVNPGGWVPVVITDRPGIWFYYISVTGTAVSSNPGAYLVHTVRKNYAETRKSITIRHHPDYNNHTIDWAYGAYEFMPINTYWDYNEGTYFMTSGTLTISQYLFFIPTTANRGM